MQEGQGRTKKKKTKEGGTGQAGQAQQTRIIKKKNTRAQPGRPPGRPSRGPQKTSATPRRKGSRLLLEGGFLVPFGFEPSLRHPSTPLPAPTSARRQKEAQQDESQSGTNPSPEAWLAAAQSSHRQPPFPLVWLLWLCRPPGQQCGYGARHKKPANFLCRGGC